MKKTIFNFALFTLISVSSAYACTEVDLRVERCQNEQARLPELRNQGESNYCFAFTLADYYSYLTCQNFSGLHAGLQTQLIHLSNNPTDKLTGVPTADSLNRGSAIESADALIRAGGGLCLEQDYPSDREEFIGKGRINDFFAHIWNLREQQPDQVLNCIPRSLPSAEWSTIQEEDSVSARLHRELDQRKPVPINFAGSIVTNANLAPRSAPSHYALVVGRKRINGRCHLLVRDSTPVHDDVPWVFDNGYVWIPENRLLEQVREISISNTPLTD